MPSLRGLLDTLSLYRRTPGEAPDAGPAASNDADMHDLPAVAWIPRAAIVIGTVRGSPVAGQSLTEGRLLEIAYLPPNERAARLQVLIEEQRSLRSHRGFMGVGR